MNHNFLLALSFLSCLNVASGDPVDSVKSKYTELLANGQKALCKREIEELTPILEKAMAAKDLVLAAKAMDRIKQIKEEVTKLEPPAKIGEIGDMYPASNDYRMVWSNGEMGTEKGNEIVCKFARISRLDSKEGTLTLTMHSGAGTYSNTPNDIFVLDKKGGKEIAVIKGIGTNKKKVVPLTLSAQDFHEISIVVRGSEALHLFPYKDGIPKLFLTIE